ncbi:hypothetical protein BS101_05870 [Clostridium kluyveri]|uniref:Uncharacterized protein n=1 Tax=Clostridium kluyveri TaxID=1534 RepID=A0A1L5F5L7_CLOKL|nr:hypothetical protein BS101_05870 [Clostridium kluyveri]
MTNARSLILKSFKPVAKSQNSDMRIFLILLWDFLDYILLQYMKECKNTINIQLYATSPKEEATVFVPKSKSLMGVDVDLSTYTRILSGKMSY